MKVVHISDLHYPIHEGTEKLITKIIKYYESESLKPIVVCTGDLLDTPPRLGDNDNYINSSNILKNLKENGFQVLLCPGNHDLKKGGIKKRKLIHSNLIRFDKYYKNLLPKNSNFGISNSNSLLEYPIIHKFDNHFFIGLNSMTYQPKSAKGLLGLEQLDELEIKLKEIKESHPNPIILVYLHHNPLPFTLDVKGVPNFGDKIISNKLRLIDRKSFLNKIRGINILLFGHLHYNERKDVYETKYNINCIQQTGGSTDEKYKTWTEIDTITFESQNISI